ncbi:MAG: sigma-70 family RNA polymerase sigma factor, partial [Synergistaceae bacterium]|nr:sigma-70 family RNA polymerase sigma factor [Synergistaceae bacterium]
MASSPLSGLHSFMPILAREARKLAYGNSFTADDLVQEGVLAAISALESYDPERGNLDGYVRVCARNRMISYLRHNGHEYPMDDEALDECMRRSDGGKTSAAHAEVTEIAEKRDELRALKSRLSAFEESVLRAYIKGGGISGAAGILKCDRKKVDNALQRIRGKARSRN